MHPKFSAVIVAAGAGTRLGASVPKAFVDLANMPLLAYSLTVFDSYPYVNDIVVVVPKNWIEKACNIVDSYSVRKCKAVIAGGIHRWESVRHGVKATTHDTKWVMIHDAARPFVSHAVIESLMVATKKFLAVVTVTPEVDTIRRYCGDTLLETLDRSQIVRVGTPQIFQKQAILESFVVAETLPTPPTDEAFLFERRGIPVGLAWGDEINFKITTPNDLTVAEAIIKAKNSISKSNS